MVSIFGVVLLVFGVSQFYWAWRAYVWMRKHIRSTAARVALGGGLVVLYAFLFAYCFGWLGNPGTEVSLTPGEILLAAPFLWWIASSIIGFLIAVLLALVWLAADAAIRAGRKLRRATPNGAVESPGRRRFLERAAAGATAAPFVAGAYGLLYGRLNLETTKQPIRLARLPKAFEGFRIAQLSDIHIGPFMPKEEIRKFAGIANALKPDLIVLTGDFVTWDPATQLAVVEALSGLKAPFGVFGSLGNHDAWARVEDSITALFQQTGVRILRHEAVPITSHGESLNLIGVDFQTLRRIGPTGATRHLLRGVETLMSPGQVNILLSHNPDTFDRAAELGIDLSLAGHTHGGQAALEFISPELAPSRLVTPYVAGWFQKPGGQLYVNRGIGTIGVPIRIGAPPEITVYELVRG
jgi:predicted MPP superfamily phosphohydrolase